jgi:hypothetical protein
MLPTDELEQILVLLLGASMADLNTRNDDQ